MVLVPTPSPRRARWNALRSRDYVSKAPAKQVRRTKVVRRAKPTRIP
jgi:hypothetical protein